MGLQFIIGGSGTGKSYYGYDTIIREAERRPDVLFYILVPEQFTLKTQKTVVEMTPGKGILNIDVLSFQRLASHVLEEVGGDSRKLLSDIGKSMVLQKLAQGMAGELPYLGGQLQKPGYLDEVKSLVSEFMQYDIHEDEMDEMLEKAGEGTLLGLKLSDVKKLYLAFRDYLEGRYMTGEEVMDVLQKLLPLSEKLRGSVILLDGFTGFTPIQVKVIRELLSLSEELLVTVTMDAKESLYGRKSNFRLFSMSQTMIRTLSSLTDDVREPVLLFHDENSRFCTSPELRFLEEHLFRYHQAEYHPDPEKKEREAVHIFAAGTPRQEIGEAARRIRRLVREKGLRFGEIAVVTGNLEEYAPIARQVFEENDIPYFIDETHSILMNPYVEFLRSSLEILEKGFSYESVFRYLRCGLSDITREETDRLENYVLAFGIRGLSRWREEWSYLGRDMKPEELAGINEVRRRFLKELSPLTEGLSGRGHDVLTFCRVLYEFSVRARIQEKLKERELFFTEKKDPGMVREYAGIYRIVMELLDQMAEILGQETLGRREFIQLLETGFSKAKIALIPPGQDQILFGDMERTRLKDIKALFFVGVNEGSIPRNADGGGILTEIDREFFAEKGIPLAPSPKEQMNIQRFYLYLNLTKPQQWLTLSFSRTNSKGEALSPAFLISGVQRLFPDRLPEEAGAYDVSYRKLEHPEESLEELLKGLAENKWAEEDPFFSELYSWYLSDPGYSEEVKKMVEAHFMIRPADRISKSVAAVLYGEVSPFGATRLEHFAACAYAHYLQYGLKLMERKQYEFAAADLGNLVHQVLQEFAKEVQERKIPWKELDDARREALVDEVLDKVAGGYGDTILKSSARNHYIEERARRILKRTTWALTKQLSAGNFLPEGFEVSVGGGRIDRVDVLSEDGKVYVKVIDYKTGNTRFDLLALYHGLQLQLLVYLDGAMKTEAGKHPGSEVIPAGMFYYNVKDPMIKEKISADMGTVDEALLKELKMNGLAIKDQEILKKMDVTLKSLPAGIKKDGNFTQNSSVADRTQFRTLFSYMDRKVREIREEIREGEAGILPYQLGKKNACTWCPYRGVCGFDRRIPGYEYRNLEEYDDAQLWNLMKEAE